MAPSPVQIALLLYCTIQRIAAKHIIDGLEYTSIRELFNDSTPIFSDQVGAPSVLDIMWTDGFENYLIRVNNETWLYSGDTAFRSDGKWASMEMIKYETHIGFDGFGQNYEVILYFQDTSNPDALMLSHFKYYHDRPDILIFAQGFPDGLNDTALTPNDTKHSKQSETNKFTSPQPTGVMDDIITVFPSFKIEPKHNKHSSPNLGFVHFGGFHSSYLSPQFGSWTEEGSKNLSGGIQETGPFAIFDKLMKNTIVIAPLSLHMAVNDKVFEDDDQNGKQYQVGLLGNISQIEPQHGHFKVIMKLTKYGGGVNRAMREWGDIELEYWAQRKRGNSHDRDFTLQYLGYSTDNGAYYYYETEPNKTYEDTLIDVAKHHQEIGIPSKWVLLDSWWYYKGENGGVKNWTARPDIFPNGLKYLYEQTGWKVQAHNRYWSPDNDYIEKYPFTCEHGRSCLPTSYAFWDDLFSDNKGWGLAVYEQDWLQDSENDVNMVQNTTWFGSEWLAQMGMAAYQHDISIQYCMAFPRHVMTSVALSSVTQARASQDYHPGNEQWRIGISSIFNAALDIAPSKDSFWSMPGVPNPPGHYGDDVQEPYNRLQSLVLSLSNGPWTFADQIGRTDIDLVMRCCNADGLVLRPDYSATEIDKYFLNAAGLDESGNALSDEGEVWTTTSVIGDNEYDRFYYVFSVNMKTSMKLYPSDFDHYRDYEQRNGVVVDQWIAFETNSTSNYKMVSESKPLKLSVSDKWSFEYWTLIPIYKSRPSGYYLQGEVDKWISVSRQRFKEIIYKDSGEVIVNVMGAVGETVNVAFVQYPEMKQHLISCTITETQKVVVRMPAHTCSPTGI